MNREIEKIIADIIQHEMELEDSQIWIYNQDFVLGKDPGLYIIVEFKDSYIISNNNYFEDNPDEEEGGIIEIQESVSCESLRIMVISKDSTSRERKHEVPLALQSIYSEQQQEYYNFKIHRIPFNFINTSLAEGPAMLTRFDLGIKVNVWHRKTKTALTSGTYFNKFSAQVDDDKTIDTDTPICYITHEEE